MSERNDEKPPSDCGSAVKLDSLADREAKASCFDLLNFDDYEGKISEEKTSKTPGDLHSGPSVDGR